MSHLRLSVLDQSPISEGSTGAQALANTIDLLVLCVTMGLAASVAIPAPIASAMLAGVLLTVCLAPARAVVETPLQIAPSF